MTGAPYENTYTGSKTFDATDEWSLPNNATFNAGVSNPGRFRALIHVPAAAVAADEFVMKFYVVVNGQTIAQNWSTLIKGTGAIQIIETQDFQCAENWDLTIKRTAGTNRLFNWAISEASQPSASVTQIIGTIIANAAGEVNIGDKTSFALSAAGITAVQSGLATASNLSTLNAKLTGTVLMQAGGSLVIDGGGALTLKVTEIHQIHGLESGTNLTVSATARSAGAISQTISTVAGTTTVTR